MERQMHALVIEDDAVTAMLIEDEPAILDSPRSTSLPPRKRPFTRSRRRYPDLVTSDGSLPSGSGASAVRRINKLCSTPVIFVTGDPEGARSSAPGVRVLEKPCSFTQLTAVVEEALTTHR
jgi:CheY-like chemotaxis protein